MKNNFYFFPFSTICSSSHRRPDRVGISNQTPLLASHGGSPGNLGNVPCVPPCCFTEGGPKSELSWDGRSPQAGDPIDPKSYLISKPRLLSTLSHCTAYKLQDQASDQSVPTHFSQGCQCIGTLGVLGN